MTAIVLVAAAGMFVLGVVAGVVAVVSYGIHREQRRFRGEQDIGAGPDARGSFLAEQAPDVVSRTARRLNGLYVRHAPHGKEPPVATAPQSQATVLTSRQPTEQP